ncbi:MAG: S8 family serine peptidase [Trueperaceae bacterium]|nr:S8 family serine peptidase [Trueperaceae bacterium]
MRRFGLLLALLVPPLLAACSEFGSDAHLDAKITAAFERCDDGALSPADARAASQAWIEAARAHPEDFEAGSLLVGYQNGGIASAARGADRAAARVAAVRRDHGLNARASEVRGVDRVRARDPIATATRLLRDPRVRYAHPEPKLRTFGEPNDAYYAQQWSLPTFGVDRAWEVQTGDAAVRVAIIDVGFDVTHEDLHSRFDPGWDFVGNDADVSTGDAHGTHVAGILGAASDNALGIAGVAATGVRMVPLKIAEEVGPGMVAQELSATAVAAAVAWASGVDPDGPDQGPPPPDPPVDVISISLGTVPPSAKGLPVIDEAVLEARRRGVLVFAASGNSGSRTAVSAPANGPCAIAVGSVDEDRGVSAFSNYDRDTRQVDLVAPGGRSAGGAGILSTFPADRYGSLTGTSMATPFAAAGAALLISEHPELRHDEVLDQLFRTAERPRNHVDPAYGFGIVCVDAALGAATRCGR